MAKRSRVGGRPGQRRPLQRSSPRPERTTASPRPSNSLTSQELARAAELEAAILAEEELAAEARRNREKARRAPVEPVARVGASAAPLSVRAAEEYAYVRRDIRRITIVGGGLLLILAVLHVMVNVAHLFTL